MAVRRIGERFAVEFQQAGERVFRRCPPGITKAEASQYETELRRSLFRRASLGERPIVPLATAIELWLTEAKRNQKKPRQNALLLAEFVGNKALEQASDAAQAAVQAWSGILKSSTINRRLCVLKAVCKHAWRRGLSEINYSGRIPLLREPDGREVYLTPSQILRLARAAPNAKATAAIMILAYTGLRINEFLRLPKTARNAKTLPASSKNRKPRLVPIVDTIRPYLRELPLGVSYRTFIEWFWEARDKAKMPHVRIHDLRHTCASLLAAKHVPLDVIADILGDHMLTARRYVHLLDRTKAEAMRRIG